MWKYLAPLYQWRDNPEHRRHRQAPKAALLILHPVWVGRFQGQALLALGSTELTFEPFAKQRAFPGPTHRQEYRFMTGSKSNPVT